MESKKDIRKHVLAKRNLLKNEDRTEKSHLIYERIVTHILFLKAEEIYCYIDYKNEVETRKIIEKAWELGKKVAVPKIVDGSMEFYYIQSFEDLSPGSWGIPEPSFKPMACGNNVLVIMPGAVFDKDRHRIGYGKGFYDIYLSKHKNYQTMALAFELQMLENIPADEHDVCPQIIITEEHIYA